ncbi:hypothetical protein GCM10028833_05650 [Glycomyces tarimensis]
MRRPCRGEGIVVIPPILRNRRPRVVPDAFDGGHTPIGQPLPERFAGAAARRSSIAAARVRLACGGNAVAVSLGEPVRAAGAAGGTHRSVNKANDAAAHTRYAPGKAMLCRTLART